jgi:diguanylate cyclase (GGDEF)-like protein
MLIETDEPAHQPEKFAFLHLDLDYFKAFNDYYGYARGDVLIRFTASLLRKDRAAGGDGDFVGHFGDISSS